MKWMGALARMEPSRQLKSIVIIVEYAQVMKTKAFLYWCCFYSLFREAVTRVQDRPEETHVSTAEQREP